MSYRNLFVIVKWFLQCSAGGCLIELAQQLAVIMIGKQIINNAQEILLPKMKAWWQSRRVSLYYCHVVLWCCVSDPI